MKKKYIYIIIVFVMILCLMVCIVNWLGIGYRSSGSAVLDLKAELETIYGEEYTGKEMESGTEDMKFVVEPKTFFLTNWNLRQSLSIDYKYECKVIFTNYVEGKITKVRTITYQGVDPMGMDHTGVRAHLEIDSKTEIEEIK